VTGNGKVHQNWRSFLRDNDSKTELYHFLADNISEMDILNIVIGTNGEDAVSNQTVNLDAVAPCSHEEADTRLFVHARHATAEEKTILTIVANDTDVRAIAVSTLPTLQNLGLQHLWLVFGQGRNQRWLPIHALNSAIDQTKIEGMLFFHAFTGCDVVSAFRGNANKSAW
jgi:hypothetical protein